MDMNKLNGIDTRFLAALQRTYAVYLSMNHGSRSPKKPEVLVTWIKQELEAVLGNKYTVTSMYEIPKPDPVKGRYYDKNVNISVSRDGKDVGIIDVGFVNSSLGKNTNNYIGGQLGLIANLRSNNIVFGSLFCLTNPVPEYEEDAGGNMICKKLDYINNDDIKTYHTLVSERPKPLHAPDVQGICIVNSDVIIGRDRTATTIPILATRQDLSQPNAANLNTTNLDIVFNEMDIKTFFTNFAKKVEAKSQQSRLRKFFNCFLQKIIDVCHFFKK